MGDNLPSLTKRLALFGAAIIFVTIAINFAVAILSAIWLPLLIIMAGILVVAVVIITLRNRYR